MKDTSFYDAESAQYSAKRYPRRPSTLTQYFFLKRLRLTLSLAAQFLRPGTRLLEIGAADGVVIRAFADRFRGIFSSLDAVDLSPQMVQIAQERTPDSYGIRFEERSPGQLSGTYDFVLEIGVLNYLRVDEELPYVAQALEPGGLYICSVAGTSSLQYRIKGGDYRDIRPYKEYEALFRESFSIERRRAVGFFVPWLWKLPVVARILQPLIEAVLSRLCPSLGLEIIYVLKKR